MDFIDSDRSAAHAADLGRFVVASPSSYHAAHEVAVRAAAAGFVQLDETADWSDSVGAGARVVIVRDGAVIVAAIPANASAATPFRIVGAHTDSPGFKLKPKPTTAAAGWLQAGVEVYGGPLLTSWLDREIELAGRVVSRDGAEHLVRTGPYLRIPQLAIHLDRDANAGFTLDRQRHVQPVFGTGEVTQGDLVDLFARLAGVDSADVLGYDLLTADTQEPRTFGLDDALLASGRLDNLSSVHAGLTALLSATGQGGEAGSASTDGDAIVVLAAFDHEELGSESRSGASGPFLQDVLTRIGGAVGARGDALARAFSASWVVSADAGHAVHPNYPEKHDPVNRPLAGKGPLLKINANQRYSTDAHGAALWARASAAAGVPFQEFVSNNTVPCGSTIGPLTATRLGIRTVDVGVPLLSMHSARELVHVDDAVALAAALTAFYAGA
jgi:aspartyl aminopeptidase